jgi:hypothetical protein
MAGIRASMETSFVKIVTFVPEASADAVRKAIGGAGAGKIGNYSHCTFSNKGIGRFLPSEGAHPVVGKVGQLEAVEEERIETICDRSDLQNVILAIKKVHPYEEAPIDVYPVEMI